MYREDIGVAKGSFDYPGTSVRGCGGGGDGDGAGVGAAAGCVGTG